MMIVGFDICHDVQQKSILYGALTATMNDTYTSYFSCVEPHERGDEISAYLATGITSKYLQAFLLCFA